MPTHQRSYLLTALLSLAFASSAVAQSDTESAKKLAKFGGEMHAVAKACGDYTDAQLKEMKAQQQSTMTADGLSPAAFDAAFTQGFEGVQKKISSGTTEQKTKMCAQFKTMPKM